MAHVTLWLVWGYPGVGLSRRQLSVPRTCGKNLSVRSATALLEAPWPAQPRCMQRAHAAAGWRRGDGAWGTACGQRSLLLPCSF
jgi:hypothetical protein